MNRFLRVLGSSKRYIPLVLYLWLAYAFSRPFFASGQVHSFLTTIFTPLVALGLILLLFYIHQPFIPGRRRQLWRTILELTIMTGLLSLLTFWLIYVLPNMFTHPLG